MSEIKSKPSSIQRIVQKTKDFIGYDDLARRAGEIFVPEDIVKLPNQITAASFVLGMAGAKRIDRLSGLAMIGTKFIGDLADGRLARGRDEVTEFGKYLDPTLDKINMLAIMHEAKKHDMVDNKKADYIMARHAMIIGINGLGTVIKHRKLETNKPGKRAIALEAASVSADIAAHHLKERGHAKTAEVTKKSGHIAFLASIPVGMMAVERYAKAALGPIDSDIDDIQIENEPA